MRNLVVIRITQGVALLVGRRQSAKRGAGATDQAREEDTELVQRACVMILKGGCRQRSFLYT